MGLYKMVTRKWLSCYGANKDQASPLGVGGKLGFASSGRYCHLVVGSPVPKGDAQAMNDGSAALCTASQQGHAEVVKLLCDVGANKHQTTNKGWTPLSSASQLWHVRVLELLRNAT